MRYIGAMNQAATTTIKITVANRDLLDELGDRMQERDPQLWSNRPPYNAIVGYAVTHALNDKESQ